MVLHHLGGYSLFQLLHFQTDRDLGLLSFAVAIFLGLHCRLLFQRSFDLAFYMLRREIVAPSITPIEDFSFFGEEKCKLQQTRELWITKLLNSCIPGLRETMQRWKS